MRFKAVLLGLLLLGGTAAVSAEVTNATSVAFGFCPSGAPAAAADSVSFGYVAPGLAATAADSPVFGYVSPGLSAASADSPVFGYLASESCAAEASSDSFVYVAPGLAMSTASSAGFAYVVPGSAIASSSSASCAYYPSGTVLASASSEPFEFGEPTVAAVKGTIAWKFNLLTGCCTAQLRLACTNGFDAGISNLRFLFQDRCVKSVVKSALWDSAAGTFRPEVVIDGTPYRYVELDATKLDGTGATVVYGVKKVPPSVGFVPPGERLIEIRSLTPYELISDIGYVTWESGGRSCAIAVSAVDGMQGELVRHIRAVMKIIADMTFEKPLSVAALNQALAVGLPIEGDERPFCDMVAFSSGPSGFFGRVEAGKTSAQGVRTTGNLGSNAQVVLTGAKSLGEAFEEIGRVEVDAQGDFKMPPAAEEYRFFKLRLDVEGVIE